MKRTLVLACLLLTLSLPSPALRAVVPPASKKPEPTVEQRLADIEAYINNTTRATDGRTASKIGGPGPAHNGWMMTCSALVLFMTLPGLALFYGGLVRRKNVLSVLAQCTGIAGIVTVLWWICGYSLAFGRGGGLIGNLDFAFFNGVDATPNGDYSPWVSQNVFCMYQLMFAIITPALIIGATAERMRYPAVLLFVVIWMFVVYLPVAHMVWGAGGSMNGLANDHARIRAIDFAGGLVVHMTSGWSALALCVLVGKRLGHGRAQMPPHSMVLCMVGTGMLWVGWYGFNAGSALAADTIAANAFVATTLAAAVASCVWGLIEYCARGRLSVLGLCSGAVAGLATITPASGFVTPNSAVLIGLFAGVVPYFACNLLKGWFGYDDALDTFGVHAVGGTLGVILAGVFASAKANANLDAPWIRPLVGRSLWLHQMAAAGVVLVLSVVGTVVIASLVQAILRGLRVSEEVETIGLDLAEHGEEGYLE